MPDKYRTDFWVEQFAKDFMEPAKKIAAAGKYFMYHNHAFEFERLPNGKLFLEVLMETMPAELMGFTIDTYWVQAGGADPVQWIEKLKDRIPCVHFKDMSALSNNTTIMAPVGEGNLNWPAIIKKLELNKPQYRELAAYGQMGRTALGVKWEETDKADELRRAAGC